MRGAHAGETLGLGFHRLAEGVAAVGAWLLQVEAEVGEVILAQGFGQQRPVAIRAPGRVARDGAPAACRPPGKPMHREQCSW